MWLSDRCNVHNEHSLTFKAFMMFVIFLPFQRNLYVVLAHGKSPKNSVHRDLFKRKNPNIFRQLHPLFPSMALPWTCWGFTVPLKHPAAFYAPNGAWIGLWPN